MQQQRHEAIATAAASTSRPETVDYQRLRLGRAKGRISRLGPAVGVVSLTVLVLVAIAPAAQAARHRALQYFLSMGDSYSVGYQDSLGHTTLNGPANQLLPLARRRGYRFKLINLGCAGATSGSMLTQEDCPAAGRAPGAAGYPGKTQVQAAVDFMRKHRGQVGLVTISIGGNNITPCIPRTDRIACVRTIMKTVSENVRTIVKRLRAAGGKKLRIVGSTYPDVVLGAWVRTDVFGTQGPTVAAESLTAFARSINPGLRKAYASARGAFVDVTQATGAYGPFVTTNDPPYGQIPVPVAKVCTLTYFCSQLGIHMTTAGYHIIARLEAATLPRW
jgi:lysophospholipase L1-like esterase